MRQLAPTCLYNWPNINLPNLFWIAFIQNWVGYNFYRKRKMVFHLSPIHFHVFELFWIGNIPCCKQLPSKPSHHFMLGHLVCTCHQSLMIISCSGVFMMQCTSTWRAASLMIILCWGVFMMQCTSTWESCNWGQEISKAITL